MNKLRFFYFFICIFSSSVAYAASFDCKKAGTQVEHLICGNVRLSFLDVLMADRYKRVLEVARAKRSTKEEQLTWLASRNKCLDASCLIKSYQERIKRLDSKVAYYLWVLNAEAQINNLVFDDAYSTINKSMPKQNYLAARPANMYQLVASADNTLCNKALAILNQPGTYQGKDKIQWWVSNNNLVKWNIVRKGFEDTEGFFHSKIEEFVADFDGDKQLEYAYRLNGSLSSSYYQSFAILESTLNQGNVTINESGACQADDQTACEKSELSELEGKIWAAVHDRHSSIKGMWDSRMDGTMGDSYPTGNLFISDYFRSPRETLDYPGAWFINLMQLEDQYGVMIYPQIEDQFRIMLGLPSKDDIIQYKCVYAPKALFSQ